MPAGGDCFVLSHILHDWNDEQCVKILGNCRKAMKPDGRLLIVEMVLPPGDTPHPGKMLDMVIVGLDELKSVLIISAKPKDLSKVIMHELGLGMTIIHGRGGFSGATRDILFLVVERLDLSDLKEIVLREDPDAFMAIENLHEVVSGRQSTFVPNRRKRASRRKKVAHDAE